MCIHSPIPLSDFNEEEKPVIKKQLDVETLDDYYEGQLYPKSELSPRFFERECIVTDCGKRLIRLITVDLAAIVATELVYDVDGGFILVATAGGTLRFPHSEDDIHFTTDNAVAFLKELNTKWMDYANETKLQ